VYSRDCPKLKEEKKIMEIKTLDKLPYSDARKKYRQQIAPTFSRSFASITATPIKKCSISTQTETDKLKDKPNDKNLKMKEIALARPDKAMKPVKESNTSACPPKKNPPKITGSMSPRREKTPSPGPSTNKKLGSEESMEDEECLSETEVLRLREKGRRRRIRR
jgi:hypothetical protein